MVLLNQFPFCKKSLKFLYYHKPGTIFLVVKDLISIDELVSIDDVHSSLSSEGR